MRNGKIQSPDDFWQQFNVNCPLAYTRLVTVGIPATVLSTTAGNSDHVGKDQRNVQAATASFITIFDNLDLEQDVVNVYSGLLTELCVALNKLKRNNDGNGNDSGGYDYRATLTNWLKKLSTTMHASDNLTERDLAQLRSDVQQSYTVFTEELSWDVSC